MVVRAPIFLRLSTWLRAGLRYERLLLLWCLGILDSIR